MDFFNFISLTDAQAAVATNLAGSVMATEIIPLPDSLGRCLAENTISRENIPPFNRSTVDGFAVRSADTFGAGEGIPALLDVVAEVAMGEDVKRQLAAGQAAAVPTGGMLPAGADAVVMMEHAERPDSATVLVLKTVAPGDNMIARGEDIAEGTVVVRKGQIIRSQDIGALAACGVDQVPVYRKPVAGIISTGDEIVEIFQEPTGGQVRDINSYTLAAMLTEAGCLVRRLGVIKDNYNDLRQALLSALETCNLVILSGGSSVGMRDHTVKVIEELGKKAAIFHGVAVKPGKPTIFGMIGRKPVFGLPGHPAAAMAIGEEIVKPAVAIMTGREANRRLRVAAKMSRSVASAPGRDDLLRVRLIKSEQEYLAEPVFGKSGLISTMTQADGIVHIPAAASGLYQNDLVEVILFSGY